MTGGGWGPLSPSGEAAKNVAKTTAAHPNRRVRFGGFLSEFGALRVNLPPKTGNAEIEKLLNNNIMQTQKRQR